MDEKTGGRKKRKVLTQERVAVKPLVEIPVGPPHAVVGQSIPRTDAQAKVTGKLAYAADYPEEGFLHGKILRSPYPHARIKSINVAKARNLPGVVAVLTAQDVPGRKTFGPFIPDQPVICGEKVRYVGDAVALVAAESERIAHQALSLIDVEYEPLPAVFDPQEALRPDAPAVHGKNNLLLHSKLRKGDIEKGFAEADIILERSYRTPFIEHAYLEPDVSMAIPQPDGTLLIEGPTQAPFAVRRNIAAVLGVPINRIRVRQTPMGGGFGGRLDAPIDLGCRAAVLATHTGRPVRVSLEREEVTLQTPKRRPYIMTIKIGAKKDGKLVAFEGSIYNENGAYASVGPLSPPSGGVNVHSMIMMTGPYEIPHCKVDAYLVYTNNPIGGAMRGFGAPQVCFAHESILDELALKLGINPLEIRRKNAFQVGSITATGQVLDQSVGLKETLEACAKAFDWQRRYREVGCGDPERARRRGVGIGIGWYRARAGYASEGCGASVLLYTGITEMGQGAFTVLPQICAESLGVAIEDIRLVTPDTDLVPESGPTVASRSTTLMGNAIILATREIKEAILEMAAKMLSLPAGRLEAKNRYIYDRENPGNYILFKDAVAKCMATGKRLIGQGWWTPPTGTLDPETGQGEPYFVYSYSTHMAEVNVDTETGIVEVTDYTAAYDIGKAINPKLVEGQIEGGIGMGVGFALMEEIVVKEGIIQNLGLEDFLIPTVLDMPPITPIIIEQENKLGPYGAKGIGEMANIPSAPAIINAIAHACGGRVRTLPADPEKVFRAIRERSGPAAE
ncbi:MAG: xanthine dehydrogenase family protein molybdopterin-binding subunit [Deltaproteobacteria bacterium]|nr:xanthine dehydrogenase family protein molybdopterin-binding subunit [Deltaproteobacteria bacterium]